MSKYVLEEHNGEGRIVGIPVSQKSELGLLIGDTKEQLECGLPMNGKVYRCSDIKEMEAKIEDLQQELNNRPQWISVDDNAPINDDSLYAVNTKTGPIWCYLNKYSDYGSRDMWQTLGNDDFEMCGTEYIEYPLPPPPTQED